MRKLGLVMGLVLALGARGALAQDVPVEVSKLAGQQIKLHVYPFLSEADLTTLRFVAKNKEALKLFITAKGYSALAVAPEEGFAPGGAPAPSAVALGDFADPATAAAEVVKACDAKRKGKAKGKPACVVVLEVGPAG
ncbi:MAG: hypothetical protein WCS20_06500 [Alphaproteobacteria bacterium]|jgi:hypothetical protein